jgi:meiotically up-regulated gene 157 (Mug157) protein
LDSIGHFFQLTNDYIETTGDVERVILSKDWLEAIPRIFQVLQDQMKDTWPTSSKLLTYRDERKVKGANPVPLDNGYRFQRYTDRPTETLGEYGIGGITKRCGLIRSAFRPSDDATTFPYLVKHNVHPLCGSLFFLIKLLLYLDSF